MKTFHGLSLPTPFLAVVFSILVCTSSSYATRHTITFTSYYYDPNQLTVAVGDTIIWQGDFTFHPLQSTSVPLGANTFFHSSGTSFSYVVAFEGTYNYRCYSHGISHSMLGSFDAILTGVDDKQTSMPEHYQLHQNFPNPFNPTTTIHFSVPATQIVTLKVFDLLGNEIATLVNEKKSPGNYAAEFDGKSLASGIYLYRLEAKDFSGTKKLLLLK